jgi:hypothetical protein
MEHYKVTDAPLSIWLNYGELEHDDTHDNLHREDGQITWRDIQIDSSDVKYVRADEIARLTKQRDELLYVLEAARNEQFKTPRLENALRAYDIEMGGK